MHLLLLCLLFLLVRIRPLLLALPALEGIFPFGLFMAVLHFDETAFLIVFVVEGFPVNQLCQFSPKIFGFFLTLASLKAKA